MAAACRALSSRMSSRDAAWATSRLNAVRWRRAARAPSAAPPAAVTAAASASADTEPAAGDGDRVHALVVGAPPGFVDAEPPAQPLAALDLQQEQVVAHVAQPAE